MRSNEEPFVQVKPSCDGRASLRGLFVCQKVKTVLVRGLNESVFWNLQFTVVNTFTLTHRQIYPLRRTQIELLNYANAM